MFLQLKWYNVHRGCSLNYQLELCTGVSCVQTITSSRLPRKLNERQKRFRYANQVKNSTLNLLEEYYSFVRI